MHTAHNVYEQKSIQDTIMYLHACCFSPVQDTWVKAIANGHFATWPALTVDNVRKYLPKSDAMVKGHMNQIRQNIRSTQPKVATPTPDTDMVQEDRCRYVFSAIMETGQIYTDLTGRFPTTSQSGNKYILVLYDYDSNSVLTAPMKNRGDKEMVRAFDLLIQSLIGRGLRPLLQRLDNEASLALRTYLTEQGIEYQLAPPHIHRRNNAERAIQTFKNHFVAGLCSVDPNFPLKLRDKLLPQATITLNLLRKSRINPRMSAYAQLNGHYDFNRAPMAPPGTRIIAHEKPDQRASWDPHGVDGFYLGPALDHYRCYQVYITKTRGTRVVDTVEFFPTKTKLPQTSSKDLASIAALELAHALQNPAPAGPFNEIGTAQLNAIRELSNIFTAALPPASVLRSSPVSPAVSLFRNTVEPAPSPTVLPTGQVTPPQSPAIAQYTTPRVPPTRAPSPRVNPRTTPRPVPPPRVAPIVPLTPHPAAQNAPYVPQGMAGENLFNTFEEEHMEAPAPPRYNTRARTQRHLANIVQHQAPRVFRPITFTATSGGNCSPQPAYNQIPMANAVINEDTGASLEYRQLIQDEATFPIWNKAAANEFGRLAQGVGGRIEGSNTIFFIPRQAVPKGKVVTYGRFVVDIRPNKPETHRVHLTMGGNLIRYPGDVSTCSADLTTSKCLWNSTISTEGAKYMCLDVKNFYLGTPMDSFEYMRIPLKLIPQEIIEEYNLLSLVSDGHVYIEVQKGMYGLPQAGILANQLLARRLAVHGYHQTKFTPGLWRHVTRPIQFTLVVDDFGVQYVGKEHAQHIIQALEHDYTVSQDWTGGLYCGVALKWDYTNKHVDLSMPGYIKDALHKYQHPMPKRPQYAPHNWTVPAYGQRIQYAPLPDDSPMASPQEITRAQGIVGTILYNARAVDPTLLVPLSTLASQLSTATTATLDDVSHLLDYCSTHPEATIRYHASDMQLKIHSDASYLSEPKAKSRIGGYFYLGNKTNSSAPPLTNGPLLCHTTVLKHVVSSVAEAEFGAVFVNAKEGTVTRTTLSEMGHKQDATDLRTDNSTADGIINNTVQQKRSKAMDMRFYWVKDRVEQGQFNVGWAPGDTNMGDYFTKHHSPAHHKRMRAYYLHDKHSPMIRHDTRLAILRGCVDLSPSSRPDRALSALLSGSGAGCSLSQPRHGHTPIGCVPATTHSIAPLEVIHRNLLRSWYTPECAQCNQAYTKVSRHLSLHQKHLNASSRRLSAISTISPGVRTN